MPARALVATAEIGEERELSEGLVSAINPSMTGKGAP
jgi:hypothetical protein